MRISRDRDEETSTTTQPAAIEAYCTMRGWTLVKMIVEPGRSAFKASRKSRPGFREAMTLIQTGAADAFVCWKIDRAARNTLDLLTFVEELKDHGAEFASVTENIATDSASGELLLTLLGALAQMESAQKSDRATEWHRHRRMTAAVPAGPPALGYRKPRPNTLEPDPDKAPHVRQAAENIAAGASVLSQVKALNAAGVKVTHRGLTTALLSPTLVGLVAVSDDVLMRKGGARVLDGVDLQPGGWEAIIDRELWERVRAVLNQVDRRTNRTNTLVHPLVRIARCHCGSKMRHHVEKWTTKSGTGTMGRLLCMDTSCLNGIGYDAVEDAVTATVLDLLDDDAWRRVRSVSPLGADEAAAATERLARMWRMVIDGTLEPEEYAEAKAEWAGRMAASNANPDLPNVADVRAAWPSFTAEERYIVLRAAIRSLVIKPATRRGGRGVDLSRVDLVVVS